jgi:hypothetical protein
MDYQADLAAPDLGIQGSNDLALPHFLVGT